MRVSGVLALLVCLLVCGGCSGTKSTDQLIGDLHSADEGDRVKASRLLQLKKGDAAKIVPAFITSLKDRDGGVRCSSAIGLGYFGEQAREAIPALKEAQRDGDARVREAAGVALSRIDPSTFPAPIKGRGK